MFKASVVTCLLLFTCCIYSEDSVDRTPLTEGFDHAALAVLHLQQSTRFFTDVLGWELKGEDADARASFLSDGRMFLSLWQVKNPGTANSFDPENNVGLNHLAFRLGSYEALDALYEKLSKVDTITIESAPRLSRGGPKKHFFIREPGGIRLEFSHTPK